MGSRGRALLKGTQSHPSQASVIQLRCYAGHRQECLCYQKQKGRLHRCSRPQNSQRALGTPQKQFQYSVPKQRVK